MAERRRLRGVVGAVVLWAAALFGCATDLPLPPVPAPPPAAEEIEFNLYLLGDGGSPDPGGDPVLEALTRELKADPSPTVVVFLGDNIYPDGMPEPDDPGRVEAERRLRMQVDAALAGADEVILVPGNHDWEAGGEGGWEAIARQQAFVDRTFDRRVRWLPRDGCPGPEVIDRGERLRLVALDTQWLLHPAARPEGDGSGCPSSSADESMARLAEALATAGERHVAVLAHHPLRSGGRHGGYFPLVDHIFPLRHLRSWLWVPLPIVGSIYPLARMLGISPQDQSSASYRDMVARLERAFAAHPPLIAAAGHEHNLQILGGHPPPWVLISGVGQFDHTTPVSATVDTTWVARESGFMRVSLLRRGGAWLEVLTVDESAVSTRALALDLARP